MAKKNKVVNDDDEEINDETLNEVKDEKEEAESDVSDDVADIISDDDFADDIVIEVDDEDLADISPVEVSEVAPDEVVLSKHKQNGKHALKYDTIFKGKKEDPLDESTDMGGSSSYFNESFDLDRSSHFAHDDEVYQKEKRLREKVYEVLLGNTDINFLNNRRKPSRTDFNQYYYLLKTHLKDENFTNIELFNELSVYFSDNLFNMFKLLDTKWRNLIINELQDHIGKSENSKEVKNRNIFVGTEVEFIGADNKIVTGVVVECDYPNSEFKIDSYENIYTISLADVTEILNNTKFKYNLNKLNNIDFL
jgi:hypothetical protein